MTRRWEAVLVALVTLVGLAVKHEEIAEMLGVTSGATKAQLHRARLLLREAMNR